MAANQLWYVTHRPDLVLLSPCDSKELLPGSVFASVHSFHPPKPEEAKWKHPKANAFMTCFGDIGKQRPRVVKCACSQTPCALRALEERTALPDNAVPQDWHTHYTEPEDFETSQPRREAAITLWLDCMGRADKELPAAEGQPHADESAIQAAAEPMFTEYLKGRVCYKCNLPSTAMKRCVRCHQARYCSRECQVADWVTHKPACQATGGAADVGIATESAAPGLPAEDSAAALGDIKAVPAVEGGKAQGEQ